MVVAHVVRVRPHDTATLIDLEDGTTGGRILARRWLNNLNVNWLRSDGEQYYARIIGRLVRGQQETRNSLEIKAFRRVADPHEMLLHILEAAFATLTFERGPPVGIFYTYDMLDHGV